MLYNFGIWHLLYGHECHMPKLQHLDGVKGVLHVILIAYEKAEYELIVNELDIRTTHYHFDSLIFADLFVHAKQIISHGLRWISNK